MFSLRDRWRRSALYEFWAVMEPIDRWTAIVAVAAAFGAAVSISVIVAS